MRILVTGGSGQVGRELVRILQPLGEILAPDRHDLDLLSGDAIRQKLREARPDVVINAAAYTAVDRAESEPELAMAVNGSAPGMLAEETRALGALLVHFSTDYVFDGTNVLPYRESDAPNPISAYGRSKLAGETAVRKAGGPHYIFRTSWVYSAAGSNFVLTMLRLARERSEVRIVDDQIGAPTWARFIAEATAQIVSRGAGNGTADWKHCGLYHLTAAGAVSWFGFAQAIFHEARTRNPGMRLPELIPIPSSDYSLPARRPANSRLDTTQLSAAFGISPPDWQKMLRQCMVEFAPADFELKENPGGGSRDFRVS